MTPRSQNKHSARAALALLLVLALTGAPTALGAEAGPEAGPPPAVEEPVPEVPAETAPQVPEGEAPPAVEEPVPDVPAETAPQVPEGETPPAGDEAAQPESGGPGAPPAGEPQPTAGQEGEALTPLSAVPAEVDPAHPLVKEGSLPVEVNLAVDEGYPWAYSASRSSSGYDAYEAGNSGTNAANVSNLALTVHQTGVLGFDWKVSTASSGNYRLCCQVNAPITAENAGSGASIQGNKAWAHVSVTITEDMLAGGSATVYLAYVRGGTAIEGMNYGVVANVNMSDGLKTVTLATEGGDYGTVDGAADGANRVMMGETLTLTAAPVSGNRFYGWVVDGAFQGTGNTYTQTVLADTSIRAVFGPADAYTARRGGTFYAAGTSLESVLADAQSPDVVELLSDQTLTGSATVPAGVTLLVPYGDNYDPDGSVNKKEDPTVTHTPQLAGDAYVYRTLTVAGGGTLTVRGTLRVGSVIGFEGMAAYSGHTSGAHGKLVVNGAVTVASGGVLDCWGDAEGTGGVTVASGGTAYEPFIVVDFAGGSNTASLYLGDPAQSPFKQYAMQNIRCHLTLQSGGELYAHCNLYASDVFNKTDAPIVAPGGLFAPAAGATVTRTYDGARQAATAPGIGRMTYTVTGGMAFQSLTMNIQGVNITTDTVDFPIPYSYAFVLEDGRYTIPQRLKLMPGAEMTVAPDASMAVTGRLYALDGLIQSDMSGKKYPTSAELKAGGYAQSALLTVDGTLDVAAGAAFGGVVQTRGTTGAVSVAAGAEVANANLQDGGVGTYDDNRAFFHLPARARLGGTVTPLSAGKDYSAAGADAWTLPGYTMTYRHNCGQAEGDGGAIDGKYHRSVTETVTIDQPMTGAWREGAAPPPVLPGDLDGDKKVDISDLNTLLRHFQQRGTYQDGDINGDGKIDITDLNILLKNFQKSI